MRKLNKIKTTILGQLAIGKKWACSNHRLRFNPSQIIAQRIKIVFFSAPHDAGNAKILFHCPPPRCLLHCPEHSKILCFMGQYNPPTVPTIKEMTAYCSSHRFLFYFDGIHIYFYKFYTTHFLEKDIYVYITTTISVFIFLFQQIFIQKLAKQIPITVGVQRDQNLKLRAKQRFSGNIKLVSPSISCF